METVQLDIFLASRAKDAGMSCAEGHANRITPGWSECAYELLLAFLSSHGGSFQAEEVRDYAEKIGFAAPPSNRAWGSIIVRAMKAGIIRRVGYAPVKNVKAHRTPASLWARVKNGGSNFFAPKSNAHS